MLANALKKNELGRYQSWWKKKYLNIYLKGLALKKDHKLRMKLFCLLSKRPDIVRRIIRNEKVKLPAEIRGKLPKYPVLKQFLHYLRLKADAAIQELL